VGIGHLTGKGARGFGRKKRVWGSSYQFNLLLEDKSRRETTTEGEGSS